MSIEDVRDPIRVLLIEDSLDDEQMALRALRRCGRPLAVRVARDGASACRALGLGGLPRRERGGAAQFVISNLKLPGLDGQEILRLARDDSRLARVPYVIFSSSKELSDVRRCLECGADTFVQKPIDFQEYIERLRSVVRWAIDGFCASPPAYVIGAAPLVGRDA